MWNILTEGTTPNSIYSIGTSDIMLGSRKQSGVYIQGPAQRHNNITITTTHDDIKDKENKKKKDSTTTCIPLRYLCGDFFDILITTSRFAMQLQHRCSTTPQPPLTTGAHLVTTSVKMETSWPLAFTSTTSTSRMEHATCSTSHNHDYRHLQSLMVQHLHSQRMGSWTSSLPQHQPVWVHQPLGLRLGCGRHAEAPLTTDIMVLQTEAGAQQHAEMNRIRTARQELQDERAHYLKQNVEHISHRPEIQQLNNDLNAQQALQDALTHGYTGTSSRWTSWLPHHAFDKTWKRTKQPTSSTSADQHRLGNVSTTQTSICRRSSCTTVHLVTEHSSSTTSMDRDITTTAVSKMDTRRLSLRDDTSCHRRYLKGQYSDKQLARTSTTTSLIAGSTTSYLARGTSDDRQLLCQQLHAPPWSDHREHRPGRQPHQEQQEGQRQERKRKGKKGKGKGYNNNYYNYNHYNTYHNNNNNHTKESQKEKVPLGATTTTPARARTSRATRTTIKERESLLRRPQHQSVGYVASLDIELPLVGSTTRRTSTMFSNTTTTSSTAVSASGLIRSAHRDMPPEGITTFNFQQLPQQQPQLINKYDKHYLLPQHHQWPECPHQDLTSTTSVPSTTCTAVKEDNHQASEDIVTTSTSTSWIANIFEIYLEGYFVAGPSSVTPVLLRRLHLGTSQTMYLFNHTTHNFLFLQLPINLFTSMATKTSCSWVQYIQQHGFLQRQDTSWWWHLWQRHHLAHLAGAAQQHGETATTFSHRLPSQQEQDTHALTHQPYRSWHRVCQQAKGRDWANIGGQHQQEENISIIQLDYTFMHDPHQPPFVHGKPHTYTFLRPSSLQQDSTWQCLHQRRATHHIKQHNYIVGLWSTALQKAWLQSDHETSLMQLVGTVATDLKLPTRVSPPYSHQSQGKVGEVPSQPLWPTSYNKITMEQRPQHRAIHAATRVTSMGTTTQHLHPQQLPRALFRQDITLRELPVQLPLQHRWLWRDVFLETSATSLLRSYV